MDECLYVSMNMFTCMCVCVSVRVFVCLCAYLLAIELCARQYTYMNKLNYVLIRVQLD